MAEEHPPIPNWMDGDEHVIEFPTQKSGTVRVRNEGEITWRRHGFARWEPVNVPNTVGKAIFDSVAIELSLSEWRHARIQELLGGGEAPSRPEPQLASPIQAVAHFTEDEHHNEVIKQGIKYSGQTAELRIRDSGTTTIRDRRTADAVHDWRPVEMPHDVAYVLRTACDHQLMLRARQEKALKDLLHEL